MGCGSSTSSDPNNNLKKPQPDKQDENKTEKDTNRDNGPDLRQEPDIEDVEVPKTISGYPPPRPPPNKKTDIYQPAKFSHIDKKARQTPADKANDYKDLISYLTEGCRTDLQKVRSIFVWLGCQDIDNTDYAGVTMSDTPRGYMKLIQNYRGSYSAFFTLLCRIIALILTNIVHIWDIEGRKLAVYPRINERIPAIRVQELSKPEPLVKAAGIPCVIIKGYAKSAGYEVGDDDDDVKTLNNSWTCVYVADGWRFVFPLWACRALVGHSTGAYTKVETKGVAVREKEIASSGVTVTQLNEYYFLTDPENLIYVAYPLESKWQLLGRTWLFEKFVSVPFCRKTYFENDVSIVSRFNGKLFAQDGYCEVELTVQDTKDFHMDYELYFNHKQSGKEISGALQLNNYVFLNRTETHWKFGIRFPESGVYKLEIVGGRNLFESDICYFKIICDEAQEDCKPFPVNPGRIGYGPNLETVQAGLKAKSHKDGLVKVAVNKQVEFNFNLLRIIQVRTELVHNTIPKEDLVHCVKQRQTNTNLNVLVTVPEQGEYALQFHAQQKDQSQFKNVCNYLLTSEDRKKRIRAYENPIEKNTRFSVKKFSQSKTTKDLADLELAIERFEKLDMDDKGDLAGAHDALEFKRVQKALQDGIRRRHLETLEKAIEQGHESRFSEKLATTIKDAEEVRDHLRKLNRFAHDILEMKQSTISELRSYKKPPEVVEDVMMATFVLLGEKRINVQVWEDIQILMGKIGRDSLIRRVKQFDTVNVAPDQKFTVDRILTKHDEAAARIASAGCGTFYVWLRNISSALSEEEISDPA